MTQGRIVLPVALLLFAGMACNLRAPHAILVIDDSAGLAADATHVAVGTSLDALTPYSTEGLALPLSITLQSDRTLWAFVWGEARDANDLLLGRCRVKALFNRQTQNPFVCELRPACDDDPDCDDGVFCDGVAPCVDRMCAAPEDPCPSSPFACVEVDCLEGVRQCSLGLHHERCSPLVGDEGELEPTYCEPSVGCTRGQPCAGDPECDDGLLCNGEEQCVAYHCIPGPPLDVDDHDPCTTDGCAEGIGRINLPDEDGSWCNPGAPLPQICRNNRCVTSVCGDGVLDLRIEACDAGAANSDTEPNACRLDCTLPTCGDGATDPGYGEVCDDGNHQNNDACLADCTPNVCGDGFVDPDKEQCDDANHDNEDTCLNDCRLNQCGDGFLNPLTEACDDGNIISTDQCVTCELASCGDGQILTDIEVCDDGNTTSGDGCRGDCLKIEACDGSLDAGEPCDDGNANPNDGCNACARTEWRATVELGFGERDGAPLELRLSKPFGIAADRLGNLFIADDLNERVWRYDAATQKVTVFAGTGFDGYSGDGGPATQAKFSNLYGVAVDGSGNVFISDRSGNRIRKVDTAGIVTTIAGTGIAGYMDGCPGNVAMIANPLGVVADGLGNVYFSDAAVGVIRRIDPTGYVNTVAGNPGFLDYEDDSAGVDATGPSAFFGFADGLAVDAVGDLYIADRGNSRVRKVTFAADGATLTTVAGNGGDGDSGDGGPATSAEIGWPVGLDIDRDGNLYITDYLNHRIRKVDPTGTISTVVGIGERGYTGDGGPAISAQIDQPTDVALGPAGELFITDQTNDVVRVVIGGIINTLVGGQETAFNGEARFARDGGQALTARLTWPKIPLVRAEGLVFSHYFGFRVQQIDPAGVITTVAGIGETGTAGDGGLAVDATIETGFGIVADSAGNIYITNFCSIRRIDLNGIIDTIAGSHTYGYGGDGGPAAAAGFGFLGGLAIDADDNLYIADTDYHRVRRIDSSGDIDTVVGTGTAGLFGDGGQADLAELDNPTGLAHDGTNLWIVDTGNHAVRRVDPSGVIDTITGIGSPGFGGDGGPADIAALDTPLDVAVDLDGGIVIADHGNLRIRKVSPGGSIDTIVGTGDQGYYGDGGPATQALLSGPHGVTVGPDGELYLTDSTNTADRIEPLRWRVIWEDDNFVRRVDSGIITTIAGLIFPGDGPFADAFLGSPAAAVSLGDPLRWLVADGITGRVREVDFATRNLRTVAGRLGGLTDADNTSGAASLARLFQDAAGIAYDADGAQVFVSERAGQIIRRLAWTDIDDLATWTIAAYAGQLSTAGYVNGNVAASRFSGPAGLAFDADQQLLYVADAGNHVIRTIDVSTGDVALFAGVPQTPGFFGESRPRLEVVFSSPEALALATNGSLFIADQHNHRVRRIDTAGTVTTVLGYGVPSSSGTGSPARYFPVDSPRGLAIDSFGNLFVTSRNTVRLVAAGNDGLADGEDRVSTIYGMPPRIGLPQSVTRCLADVRLLPNDEELLLFDACQGFLVRLEREDL